MKQNFCDMCCNHNIGLRFFNKLAQCKTRCSGLLIGFDWHIGKKVPRKPLKPQKVIKKIKAIKNIEKKRKGLKGKISKKSSTKSSKSTKTSKSPSTTTIKPTPK